MYHVINEYQLRLDASLTLPLACVHVPTPRGGPRGRKRHRHLHIYASSIRPLHCTISSLALRRSATSLVPRLSPRANEKSKERGEPGRIYHVRNVIGRENLITCGRTNELAHAVRTEDSRDSFMADRMGLDGTMLHYLAVRKATVSVHKPVHSKITLTYSLTWQADRCTSRRMAFKGY